MAAGRRLLVPQVPGRVAAGFAMKDDAGLGAAPHCGSIAAADAVNEMASRVECDPELGKLREKTPETEERLTVATLVSISSWPGFRSGRLLESAIETLVVMLDLKNSGTKRAKACAQYGMDENGMDA